jgi:hypothetical protein
MSQRTWLRQGVSDEAYSALTRDLPASRLWSLLLEVIEQRAARTPSTLAEQWSSDRFVQPAFIDQRIFVELDGHLLAAAAAFEAIELSPLAPLGVCSAVGLASQNKIVSTTRGTEVLSDPTNVMALECARRLREKPDAVVRLATSHRCVRAQEVPKQPGFAAHFRIFCLATAGREQKDYALVQNGVVEHITTMLAGLSGLEQHGYAFPNRVVKVFATPERAHVGDRIAAALPGVEVMRAPLEHPYYSGGVRFQIGARGVQGADVPLIDGGTFDWVGRLAANNRLAFVATGMGSQLAAYVYRIQPPPTTTSSS